MGIAITQVDAFTSKPFAGNPAAVCILSKAPEERWMRDVAREMNLSETAFLVPQDGGYNLRWFTPAIEVDLCGHATLASAHVLWEEGHLAAGAQARFHTRSGLLLAERHGDWIEMDFPAKMEEAAEPPADLAAALGLTPVYVGRNQFDYLVEVESATALRGAGATSSITSWRWSPRRRCAARSRITAYCGNCLCGASSSRHVPIRLNSISSRASSRPARA